MRRSGSPVWRSRSRRIARMHYRGPLAKCRALVMPFALPHDRLDQVQQELREERNLLAVMIDCVNVAVVACDANGLVTHVNERTREMMSGVCSTSLESGRWIEAF